MDLMSASNRILLRPHLKNLLVGISGYSSALLFFPASCTFSCASSAVRKEAGTQGRSVGGYAFSLGEWSRKRSQQCGLLATGEMRGDLLGIGFHVFRVSPYSILLMTLNLQLGWGQDGVILLV